MRGEGFTKRVRAYKMLTNSLLQTAPLSCWKVSYDTPIPRAQTQNRQLPRVATTWAKRHLPAPGASRAPKHLPQKAYLAVATVSLRNFFRKLVDSRSERGGLDLNWSGPVHLATWVMGSLGASAQWAFLHIHQVA